MRIDIISVQPNLLASPFEHSIMQRAQKKGHLEIVVHDLKKYGFGKHNQVDDYQFGGGAGMVMMIEPIANCIEQLQSERTFGFESFDKSAPFLLRCMDKIILRP